MWQDGPCNQQAEVVVPIPYLESGEGTDYALQEEVEDGGQGEYMALRDPGH
jgi:hypothetical protein